MKRLIVLGCSLSAWGFKKTWGEELSNQSNLCLVNLAIPGSSNQLQMKRFQEFLLNDNITDNDIIIWQITGASRSHKRRKSEGIVPHILNKIRPAPGTVVSSVNLLNSCQQVDYLFYHKECKDVLVDSAEVLQELLFYFKIIKKFTNNLLVIKGWDQAIPKAFHKTFDNYLISNKIDFLDKSIFSYTIENNLPLQDDTHPDEEAYVHFANNYLKEELTKLGWL